MFNLEVKEKLTYKYNFQTQGMEFLPPELLEKIAAEFNLSTSDRLNLRLVNHKWRCVINNSLRIWQKRSLPYQRHLDTNLWTKPQNNENAKEIRKQIVKTEKKLHKVRETFSRYHENHDIHQFTKYRGLKSRISQIKLEGENLMLYFYNGWVSVFDFSTFFQLESVPILSFPTKIRFAEAAHFTTHTIIIEYTIGYKRDYAFFSNDGGVKYLEEKDGRNDVKKLEATDDHVFVCKNYFDRNKMVIFKYSNVGERFQKTEEKLIRRNFVDFTINKTHLATLESSYAGFGGNLILETYNLRDGIDTAPEQSRVFGPPNLNNPMEYCLLKTNPLREFRRAFPVPDNRGPHRILGDFWVGLSNQSTNVFKKGYMNDAHIMGSTWVGGVEVSLNEEQEEVVYRFDLQWFHREGLYGSLSFVELPRGFGFLYGANKHVILKRYDMFKE